MTQALATRPYKKVAIPLPVRREVAVRYGCPPGGETTAACFYCGKPGGIQWFRRRDGRPSSWVWFELELDHVVAESRGGPTVADNLVLACRSCNRRKAAS